MSQVGVPQRGFCTNLFNTRPPSHDGTYVVIFGSNTADRVTTPDGWDQNRPTGYHGQFGDTLRLCSNNLSFAYPNGAEVAFVLLRREPAGGPMIAVPVFTYTSATTPQPPPTPTDEEEGEDNADQEATVTILPPSSFTTFQAYVDYLNTLTLTTEQHTEALRQGNLYFPNLHEQEGTVVPINTGGPGTSQIPVLGDIWDFLTSVWSGIVGAAQWAAQAYQKLTGGEATFQDIRNFVDSLQSREEKCAAWLELCRQGSMEACQQHSALGCAGGEQLLPGGPGPGTQVMALRVQPRIVVRRIRLCPRDATGKRMRLGKDGWCYAGLPDAQRLYRSRKAKVSRGEWNALMKAKRTASSIESVQKTLDDVSKATSRKLRTKTKTVCWTCKRNPCQCRN